jgi:heavy metal translocating P-type ATPase
MRVSTPLVCNVLHAIRGRVRFRLPAIRATETLAIKLPEFLLDQDGLLEVQCNRICASITIVYDPDRWETHSLCALLEGLSVEQLVSYVPAMRTRSIGRAPSTSAFELVLSTTGLALTLVAEGLAASVLPFLLLGSALPMLNRAFTAYSREDRLNVDVLDASATGILALQGQLPMALCMVWLVNLGDYIRDATLMKARQAITDVLAYREAMVWVIRAGQKIRVRAEEIGTGETLAVYPGERITVDGTVLSGKAFVDQRALTGESMPVEKLQGDLVYAATVVQEGKLYIKAERIGTQTEAARIVQMVEEAPTHETRIQNYAERWADDLVPYSFAGAGACSFLGGSLDRAAAVLIIDYGTGIRVAAPTTVLASMTRALRRGILIKGGRHLERLAEVDAVVFDKTGTLTVGQPEVLKVVAYDGVSESEVLSLAAAAERRLTHPVAQAIERAAEVYGVSVPARAAFEYHIGLGVESQVNGHRVLVGCSRFMALKNIPLSPEALHDLHEVEQAARSPVCIARDGHIIGLLAHSDPPREESCEVVRRLREIGVKRIVMLTGDHNGVARRVADSVGVDDYVADALPADKVAAVQSLQTRGYTVAVVGDGINDSPALAHADVGIAVHGGTEVAQETAHVVLLRGGLWKIPLAIHIAREAMDLIRQNWAIISIPNTIALGLACVGVLSPGASTVLSNGAAVLATGNALRPLLNGVGRSVREAPGSPARIRSRRQT